MKVSGKTRRQKSAIVSKLNTKESKDRVGLRPLARLLPYIMRYKGHLVGAFVFLALAAATTLSLPLAVRSMIDNGFSKADSAFIDNYFYALFAIAALLAVSSSMRYYFVIWLGERVVAAIEPAPDWTANAGDVRAFMEGKLARFKQPTLIDFHGALPREDSGKIFKARLREPYWENAGRRV